MAKIRQPLLIMLLLLFCYSVFRLLFYGMYFQKSGLTWIEMGRVFYWGLRMDICALYIINIPFFIYHFLVAGFLPFRKRLFAGMIILGLTNLPFIALNVIDLGYYKFNDRRSTVDILRVAQGSLSALGAFWNAYWYLFILFFALAGILFFLVRRLLMAAPEIKARKFARGLSGNLSLFLVFIFLMGILSRGLARRPIIPSTALLYAAPQYQPLVNNSTITFLYSLYKSQGLIKEKHYMSTAALDSAFTIKRQFDGASTFAKKNVVIFIMESFAFQYMEKGGRLRAQTPFIDSILNRSIVCDNSFANGLESNKGIVAILGSIPPFLDEPYYYSNYSNNAINGLGSILKERGYSTNFFMGAEYDHFGFGKFCKSIGIEHYISGDDYENHQHHDGAWGISDHYFLPFAANRLKQLNQPFLGVIFNLSTHFPFLVPAALQERFKINGQSPAQNSVSYFDYSLRLFFDQIKQEPWYNNTLFVFTADHNIYWDKTNLSRIFDIYRIPIFFHEPGMTAEIHIPKPIQQMDILPTVLNFLHYPEPFMSFGNTVLDPKTPGIVYNSAQGIYQATDSCCAIGYNESLELPVYYYNQITNKGLNDNLLKNGILPDNHSKDLLQSLKAFIQRYDVSLIKNKLYIK